MRRQVGWMFLYVVISVACGAGVLSPIAVPLRVLSVCAWGVLAAPLWLGRIRTRGLAGMITHFCAAVLVPRAAAVWLVGDSGWFAIVLGWSVGLLILATVDRGFRKQLRAGDEELPR